MKFERELNEINERRKLNFQVFSFVAKYLNDYPTFITEDMIKSVTEGQKSLEEMGFAIMLASAMTEDDKLAEKVEREYFEKAVKRLEISDYENNDFYKNIKIPSAKIGNWELGYQKYQPYEGFIRNDIIVKDDFTEIMQIGYFDTEFSFPTVFENGVEWMAIKPNEIETMKSPIENSAGEVAVFGLGIGYFAYMVSQKSNVSGVTVIERDERAIELFEKYILPQLENKEKIKIVHADAFEFAENQMPKLHFDTAFVDLWHDTSDGVPLYLKMKSLEERNPTVKFDYWIEKSLLSAIRWRIFDAIFEKAKSGEEIPKPHKCLSDDYLRNFVKHL